VVIEFDLECETVNLADVGERDTLDLSIVQGRPPLALQFVALPTAMSERTLQARSVPLTLDRDVRNRIEQIVDQPLPRARLTVYPCLHSPADVFSLGRMLFTTLLTHPGQTQVDVARAIDEVAQQLTIFARDHPDASGNVLTVHAGELLRARGERGPFARRHLFGDADHHAEAAAALPDQLWIDTLTLGLRAATTVRGFSICRSYSDLDPGHPEVQAEYLVQLTDALVHQVDRTLFGTDDRGAEEVREALRRLTRELSLEPSKEVS
jgi:hypothetical protein